MHLQICWDVMPGKKFFYAAQILGWGIIAVFFTVTITFTGVSFRFGDACHVNSLDSMKDFWGPLLAIAGISALFQMATWVAFFVSYLAATNSFQIHVLHQCVSEEYVEWRKYGNSKQRRTAIIHSFKFANALGSCSLPTSTQSCVASMARHYHCSLYSGRRDLPLCRLCLPEFHRAVGFEEYCKGWAMVVLPSRQSKK